MKATLLLALRRAAALAITLGVASYALLASAHADTLITVLGTVFAPLAVIIEKLVLAYLEDGKLTADEVNKAFDSAK